MASSRLLRCSEEHVLCDLALSDGAFSWIDLFQLDEDIGHIRRAIYLLYLQYRSVQPLLVACARKTSSPARVIWMSSLDSEPIFDLKEDWQLTKTMHSYNASKFQIELIVAELERRTLEGAPSIPDVSAPNGEFHHYIVSPGITATNMSTLLNIPIPGYRYLMLAAFYIVRTRLWFA